MNLLEKKNNLQCMFYIRAQQNMLHYILDKSKQKNTKNWKNMSNSDKFGEAMYGEPQELCTYMSYIQMVPLNNCKMMTLQKAQPQIRINRKVLRERFHECQNTIDEYGGHASEKA